MKQLMYLALVIVCGAALLKWVSRRSVPAGTDWKTITPEEAKARLDSGDAVTLLDVRTEAEYEESIGTQPPESLPDPDAEILVYCRSGRRSAQAAGKLAKLGYTNVSDFGGILNWPYETTTD